MAESSVLLVGGTGTISSSIMRMLAKDDKYDVYVMNRGHKPVPENVHQIICDASSKEDMKEALKDLHFDVVADFIVYTPESARDRVEIFKDLTKQYIFISTVVAYNHEDTVWLKEGSPQGNRHSVYGQNKQACEEIFASAYREYGFPVTVVRPSQTYGYERIPLSVKGRNCWSVVSRILLHKPVIVHGDGKSVWHMMHTYDFAYNFLQLMGKKEAIGRSVNLVNPATVTWDMIYAELGRQLDREVEIIHIASDTLACSTKYNFRESILGDKQYSNLYSSRVLEELVPDFTCHVDLARGITRYIEYMREHPELQKGDPEFDAWCDAVGASYYAYMDAFGKEF